MTNIYLYIIFFSCAFGNAALLARNLRTYHILENACAQNNLLLKYVAKSNVVARFTELLRCYSLRFPTISFNR